MASSLVSLHLSVGGQDKEHLSIQKNFQGKRAFYQDSGVKMWVGQVGRDLYVADLGYYKL